MYASNESNVPVYFDNMQLTHTRSPLLEETHYYPFGLTMAGISSKAAGMVENKNKYQQYEFNSDFDINLYESFYRSHDPQLGRFWQIDPKPEYVYLNSPYSSMGNNPILYTDKLGDIIDYSTTGGGELKIMVEKYTSKTTKTKKGKEVFNKNYNEQFANIIKNLEDAKETFVFTTDVSKKSDNNANAQFGYDGKNFNIVLDLTKNSSEFGGGKEGFLIEEIYHANQFLNGEVYFGKKNEKDKEWLLGAYDATDEYNSKKFVLDVLKSNFKNTFEYNDIYTAKTQLYFIKNNPQEKGLRYLTEGVSSTVTANGNNPIPWNYPAPYPNLKGQLSPVNSDYKEKTISNTEYAYPYKK